MDGSTFSLIETGDIANCAIPNKCILKTIETLVPDVATLSDISAQCSVTLTPPSANNNTITATTDSLIYTTQGDFVVLWSFGSGAQLVTQTQNVSISDTIIPELNIQTLDTIIVDCNSEITEAPSATDNCSGAITGLTTDPLTYNATGNYTINWVFTDANGNVNQQNQIVKVNCETTDINELGNLNFNVYPNPSNNHLTITNNNKETVKGYITNITGQKVQSIQESNDSRIEVELSEIPNGIFYLRLHNSKGVSFVEKIIIQH